jgi:hypothetical protein
MFQNIIMTVEQRIEQACELAQKLDDLSFFKIGSNDRHNFQKGFVDYYRGVKRQDLAEVHQLGKLSEYNQPMLEIGWDAAQDRERALVEQMFYNAGLDPFWVYIRDKFFVGNN